MRFPSRSFSKVLVYHRYIGQSREECDLKHFGIVIEKALGKFCITKNWIMSLHF